MCSVLSSALPEGRESHRLLKYLIVLVDFSHSFECFCAFFLERDLLNT